MHRGSWRRKRLKRIYLKGFPIYHWPELSGYICFYFSYKKPCFFLFMHYRMGRFWPYWICNISELIVFAWKFIDIFWHVFLLQLEKFLLEKLDVYESAVGDSNVKCTPRIAGFPPAFQAISRNPIVLDLAYNMIEFPPIENRMKKDRKAKGGFISRIFGWVYLIRVFDKYWQLIWWFLLWNIVMNFEMLCTIQIFERSRYLEILQ